MANLTPRNFPHLLHSGLQSQSAMEAHLRLYEGYVQKYNEMMEKLAGIYARHTDEASAEAQSLKGDITFALGAIKNHELFFDGLRGQPPTGKAAPSAAPEGELAAVLVKSFLSIPQYLEDLRQTAQHARGWAWTAYDLDHDYLFNYEAAGNGLPVWNVVPILAIDVYGHAYFYDYGTDRMAYVDAVIGYLDWEKAANRLAAARSVTPAAATF